MSWGRGVHNEKLKRSQRLALSGAGVDGGGGGGGERNDGGCPLRLRVVQHPHDPEVELTGLSCDAQYDTVCYLHPEDHLRLRRGSATGSGEGAAAGGDSSESENDCAGALFVYARTFPKMVLRARPHHDCPMSCIVMSEIQRQNLEVTNRDKFEFRKFKQAQPDLRLVHLEIRARHGDGVVIRSEDIAAAGDSSESENDCAGADADAAIDSTAIVIDAAAVRKTLSKRLFGCILTRFERLLLSVPILPKNGATASPMKPSTTIHTAEIICTVSETRLDQWSNDDGTSTLVPDDCFRGFVRADTMLCVTAQDAKAVTYSVVNENPPPVDADAEMPRLCVTVRTSDDDEEFLVRRRLLAPCIALTKYVQAGTGKYADVALDEECVVDEVGCCCFDRVLLYLESELHGRGPLHEFDLEYTQEMLAAAEKLSIFGLVDLCQAKLGEFESRVRKSYIRWSEVVRRNGHRNLTRQVVDQGDAAAAAVGRGSEKEKETLLLIAGAVYDVTRWLPEHPGGNTIIPKQAVNKDATVFFELYHSSRKSFIYLKQFYIGELHPADLPKVPPAGKSKRLASPSPGFLQQVREHTAWRVAPEAKEHKSF
jgi:cytochrome b involved in lipid metabolism